jgi:hypothetical protein
MSVRSLLMAAAAGSGPPVVQTDGTLWQGITLNVTNAAIYANGRFVTVGGGYNSMMSLDGIIWTPGTMQTPGGNWAGLAYGNGVFVAIAQGGSPVPVSTSSDGVNWTTQPGLTTWTGSQCIALAFGNGRFVAIPRNGAEPCTYSSDGITWTNGPTLRSNASFAELIFDGTQFVAAGQSYVVTSPDGTAWTSQPTTPATVVGLAYAGGRYVYCSTYTIGGYSTNIAASWTGVTIDPNGNYLYFVTFGNGMFITTGNQSGGSATNQLFTSPDGKTWTPITISVIQAWRNGAYGGGRFAMFSNSTPAAVSVSNPGVTWTARTVPADQWISVAYGAGTYVAVSSVSGASAVSSYDGITWTPRTLPFSSFWSSVCYGGGLFVAVASGSNLCATSPDGINWTQRTMPASRSWTSVCYGNGLFVAVAYDPTNFCATSPDGITWTQRTMPNSVSWNGVAYGMGLFVAVANGTTIAASSPDGINWTARTMPSSGGWGKVVFGNNRFYATISNGQPAYSLNGTTWTAITSGIATSYGAAFGNGFFVSFYSSAQAIAFTSFDCITWTQRTLPNAQYRAAAFGNNQFVALGFNTTVAASSP